MIYNFKLGNEPRRQAGAIGYIIGAFPDIGHDKAILRDDRALQARKRER